MSIMFSAVKIITCYLFIYTQCMWWRCWRKGGQIVDICL